MIRKSAIIVLSMLTAVVGVLWCISLFRPFVIQHRYPVDSAHSVNLHLLAGYGGCISGSITLTTENGEAPVAESDVPFYEREHWDLDIDGGPGTAPPPCFPSMATFLERIGVLVSCQKRSAVSYREVGSYGWLLDTRVHRSLSLLTPFWLAFALFSVYPLWTLVRYFPRRAVRRRKLGLCARCAYDLTGNVSGVCPECGTKVDRT